MHCHFEWHVKWGMEMIFIVSNGNPLNKRFCQRPFDIPPCWKICIILGNYSLEISSQYALKSLCCVLYASCVLWTACYPILYLLLLINNNKMFIQNKNNENSLLKYVILIIIKNISGTLKLLLLIETRKVLPFRRDLYR